MTTRGNPELRQQRFAAYAAAANPLLTVLAFVFLLAWTAWVAIEGLPDWARIIIAGVILAIWLVFVLDVIIRLTLTDRRLKWIATHPVQVLSVFFPALYPFTVLGVFTRETFMLGSKGLLKTGQAVLIASLVLIWVCSVAVLAFEKSAPDASIVNFGDAVWWANVTITSVGYGDYAPVTTPGRVVASVLMFAGLSLLGVITATVAAWIVTITSAGKGTAVQEQLMQERVTQVLTDRGVIKD